MTRLLSSTTPIPRRRIISSMTKKQPVIASSRPMVIQEKMLTPRSNLLRLRLVIAEMTYFDHSYLRTFFPCCLLLTCISISLNKMYVAQSNMFSIINLVEDFPLCSEGQSRTIDLQPTDGSIVNLCRLQRIWYRPTESDQAREYWKPVATRE